MQAGAVGREGQVTGALYGLGAAALFGMSVPLAKILVPTTGAVMLAALLYLGAGLGVTVLSAFLRDVRKGRESGLTRADAPLLLGIVLSGAVVGPVLLLVGLQRLSAVAASLLLTDLMVLDVVRGHRAADGARVPYLTAAIALLSAVMTAAVACGSAFPSREVSCPTADGGTVVADFYAASGSDGVVLAHGAAFNKASWASFASWLVGRWHQVLAIDFRGYGRSTGRGLHPLVEDVLAAARHMHRHGVTSRRARRQHGQ